MQMTKFGIMQGRLSPPEGDRFQCFPREHWEKEFTHAAQVPLDYIEWIYDDYGYDVNPLRTVIGHDHQRKVIESSGVGIRSVCADYFMDYPLMRCTAAELDSR